MKDPCSYNRFIPGTWDDSIWEEIVAMLGNDAWLERQLSSEQSKNTDLEKLIRFQQYKKNQAQVGISKVQEGWEGEKKLYTHEEAEVKITKYRKAIDSADSEIVRLQH